MTLYEIDAELLELVDQETGELMDYEAFEQLQMARERKIEGMGLWVKDMAAEAKAIKAEEDALKDRREKLEHKRDNLKDYLVRYLDGEKFSTPRVAMSFRKSPAHVELEPDFLDWAKEHNDELLRYKEPEPDKKAIMAALKAGDEIPYARLEDGGMSLTIK